MPFANIFTPIYSSYSGCGSSTSNCTRPLPVTSLSLSYPHTLPSFRRKYSFFRKVCAFKIFRFTTKLKKYSKFLTIFPKQFYMRRKRRTSNYNFVILFSYWVRAFMLEKRHSKFFQNLGLYKFTISLPNSIFILRQVRKTNLAITLNLYRTLNRSFCAYPRPSQFMAGFSSPSAAILLNSNQIWTNKGVMFSSYPIYSLFSPNLTLFNLYKNLLDLLYLYFLRSYIYGLYRTSTLLTLYSLKIT